MGADLPRPKKGKGDPKDQEKKIVKIFQYQINFLTIRDIL